MQFNSIAFLFAFLPLFLTVYFAVREELRSCVVILGSLLFCGLASNGNYWWIGLLLVITVLSYFAQRSLGKNHRPWELGFWLVLLAGLLVFFKVFQRGVYLPAGMSFYIFQIVAYMIDVFRKKIPQEQKFLSYVEQIVMFPKLFSGPLVTPESLQKQAMDCQRRFENVHNGLRTLILGLAIKVILANRLGGLWSQPKVIGYPYISVPAAWLAILAYAMQLYLDFYGYSLMAIGLGKILGYDLPANFREPYASKSVSEFYRRWHITLGAWFREYVYIPLGGNRKGTVRTLLNIAVVWLLTGLWHGVGGNYLLWAGILCFFIINERLWLGKLLDKSRVLCHFYVVFVILISWIPFAVGDWNQMLVFTGKLFGLGGAAINPTDYVEWIRMYAGLLGVSGLMMTPLPRKLWNRLKDTIVADVLVVVLFWIVVYYISTAAQDPFMYFQY